MAFITKANLNRIIKKGIDPKKLEDGRIWEEEIYFFNKYEKEELLAIKNLLGNPEKYFNEIYLPTAQRKDSYRYVYPDNNNPCYHETYLCDRMHSNFQNFPIPDKIIKKGIDAVTKYRMWFRTSSANGDTPEDLLLKDTEVSIERFIVRLNSKYGIMEHPARIQQLNSGIENFENIRISDLKKRINERLLESKRFYYTSKMHQVIIQKFSKCTFLLYGKYRNEEIKINDTDYSDQEVRELLEEYNDKFKRPVKKDLIEYYRFKFNKYINLDQKRLDALGFKPCSSCERKAATIEHYNKLAS
tara:strand:+ start:9157 stop:10059 length:903 start_codon:yes stop_codon:yes gene_type:complete